jgi:glucokinase
VSAPAAPVQVVIGVDIGGTSIKGIVTGRDGVPRGRFERPTPVADGVDAVVEAIVETVSRLHDAAGEGGVPVGVGLVMPGVVDRAAGIARWSANIGWRDLPIRRLVAERLGLPVQIDHDVRAAALAEVSAGAARGLREVLFVSIGTGLAGALITDGAVVHGARGLAGEIGHVPAVPGGEPCACGQLGCAEAYASAASVARRYARLSGGAAVPTEVVVARARDGDAAARAVLDDALVALTRMVLGVVLAAAVPWWTPPPVVVSGLGSDAGALGAALLGWTAAADGAGSPVDGALVD